MASAPEQELTDALIEGYHVAGKKAGYWGRRFLQAVRRNGGLATVQRMLLPRNQQQRKGLDAHTLGKEVIPITQSKSDIPFDVQHLRFLQH